MSHVSRRGFLGLAAVLGLAGCASTAPADTATASKARTVAHVYGTTRVPASPSRVACVGLASHDISLALGVMPVAIQASQALDTKLSPWFYDLMTKVGGRPPEVFSLSTWSKVVTAMEQQAPDLILAVNGSLTKSQYDELSKLAPVVAHPGAPANTPWTESVALVAEALGRQGKGEQLIAQTNRDIAESRDLYADYSALGTLYLAYSGAQGSDLEVFGEETNEMRALHAFGLATSEALSELTTTEKINPTQRKLVPLERVRGLHADVVIASVPHSQRTDEIRGEKFSSTLDRTNDNTILISARAEAYALQESSPLSLSWAARSLIPEIARVNFAATAPQ